MMPTLNPQMHASQNQAMQHMMPYPQMPMQHNQAMQHMMMPFQQMPMHQFPMQMQQMQQMPGQQTPAGSAGQLAFHHERTVSGTVKVEMSGEEAEATSLRANGAAFRNSGQKMCTSYRWFGAWWNWDQGWRTTVPKKLKTLAVMWIHPRIWNPVRMSRLCEVKTDALCFCLFDILPDVEVRSLQITSKRDFFDVLLQEHHRIMKANPMRINTLAADLSNVVEVAVQLGFQSRFIPTLEQIEKAEKKRDAAQRKIGDLKGRKGSGALRHPQAPMIPTSRTRIA